MKRIPLYLLIVLCVAFSLRLYPTFISGMPFSTDAWPLIRNTEQLIQNTPVPLSSDVFDGYNNYWPASSLFGAILAETFDVPAAAAMAIGIPLVAAFTIVIFYLLAQKITHNVKIALIAAALLATAFPYTLFTAGVTKETFASPIYMMVILVFLLKHDWKTAVLFSLASLALVFTHHLTAFLVIGVLVSISIAAYFSRSKPQANTAKSNLLFVAAISTVAALYFGLYAYPAMPLSVTASDLLTVAAYQTLVFAAFFSVVSILRRESTLVTAIKCAASFVLILSFFYLLTKQSVSAGAPILPASYLLFALPFIISVPLTIFALNRLYKRQLPLFYPLFWLLPVVAFAFFGLFSSFPDGLGFAVRSINFLLPPLCILVAVGVYKLWRAMEKFRLRGVASVLAGSILVCLVSLNVYSLYATVSLQEPYLGYFWRYEPSEFHASSWFAVNGGNEKLAGDVKVSYLVHGYFNRNVDVLGGLRFLEADGSAPQTLYVYGQMYQNGYVLYQGSPVALPANWTDKLTDLNLIYANREVMMYAKP